MKEKSDQVFLSHILESIDAIKEFSLNLTLDEFLSNRLKHSAITRELEIIGEATKNISNKLKENNPDIEWKKITGTRDKIIHHYFGIKTTLIFDIINHDIPILKKQILNIKQNLPI